VFHAGRQRRPQVPLGHERTVEGGYSSSADAVVAVSRVTRQALGTPARLRCPVHKESGFSPTKFASLTNAPFTDEGIVALDSCAHLRCGLMNRARQAFCT